MVKYLMCGLAELGRWESEQGAGPDAGRFALGSGGRSPGLPLASLCSRCRTPK
jgi:hypothetical protein